MRLLGVIIQAIKDLIWPPEIAGRVYYVATDGSDSNDGLTLETPFLTHDHAIDVYSAWATANGGLPTGGVAVITRDGVYPQSTALRPDAAGSGVLNKPVTIKAYQNEVVRIIGGKVVTGATLVTSGDALWSRISVAARGYVYKINLTANGITSYGQISDLVNYAAINTAPCELFINQKKQKWAEYPKRGQTHLQTASALAGGYVSYSGTRPNTWTPDDMWMCGYFNVQYQREYAKINTIDTANSRFAVTATGTNGITGSMSTDKPYFVCNILEEMTVPGEYYLHAASGTMYFYPEVDPATAEIVVSTYGGSLDGDVVRCNASSYINFENIIFEMGRRAGLRVDGTGATNIKATNCTFRNCGTDGVSGNGTYIHLKSCKVYDTNDHGVDINGPSDFTTLMHHRNKMEKCTVHDAGWFQPTKRPAVVIRSIGNYVVKNKVYNCDGGAITVYGNDNMIKCNEIYNVCRTVNDMAAVYNGGTWARRGHAFIHNYIHDIPANFHGDDVSGIYCDDCSSSLRISGNVVTDVAGYGYRLSGGHDDKYTSNVAVRCGEAAFQ